MIGFIIINVISNLSDHHRFIIIMRIVIIKYALAPPRHDGVFKVSIFNQASLLQAFAAYPSS